MIDKNLRQYYSRGQLVNPGPGRPGYQGGGPGVGSPGPRGGGGFGKSEGTAAEQARDRHPPAPTPTPTYQNVHQTGAITQTPIASLPPQLGGSGTAAQAAQFQAGAGSTGTGIGTGTWTGSRLPPSKPAQPSLGMVPVLVPVIIILPINATID